MFKLHVLWLVGLAACGPSLHLPMTAAEVVRAHDARALILYLSQPSADPVVCDASAPGPHIAVDDAVDRALVKGLRDGAIGPSIWRACVERVLASADRAARTALLDGIVGAYAAAIADPQIERDPRVQERLTALDAVYQGRAPESQARADAARALEAKLRTAVAGRALGPFARRSATQMIATLELERGLWERRIIDAALLEQLVARKDEAVLRWFAARLPDPALRSEARRRVIRLRIAASPYGELRSDAAHVEEMMMELGKNPVSPRLQPASSAAVDPAKLSSRGIVVEQDVDRQIATLAAQRDPAGSRPGDPLTLRGALWVEIPGLSRPITMCGPANELDPSPCLLAGDVTVASPLLWADRDGVLHLVERLTAQRAVDLARGGAALPLPIAVGGQPVTTLEWPITFARPHDVVAAAHASGGRGPTLSVTVEEHLDRLIYRIDDGTTVRLAVAERAAASQFRIVSAGSAGGSGSDGASGSTGSDGMAGSDASCPGSSGGNGSSGGDGGKGGDGGNGEDGGDGGDIRVVVICPDGACRETIAALRVAIISHGGHGGAGGSGGAGGRGGRGGSAGSGATCSDDKGNVTTVSGGTAGSSGSDGSSGSSGSSGSDGRPGTVQLSALRSPAPPGS